MQNPALTFTQKELFTIRAALQTASEIYRQDAEAKPVAKLAALVEQAKPHFKANPNLDREGLIAKIGRRYERLTTFAELKTLCAGKTPTTHSLKKAEAAEKAGQKDELLRMQKGVEGKKVDDWPFPTQRQPGDAPKRTRQRRDPAPMPAAPAPASATPTERTKSWPTTNAIGMYATEDAEHQAEFKSGETVAHLVAIETESGWTYGGSIQVRPVGNAHLVKPLTDKGPLEVSADGAIRNASQDLLNYTGKLIRSAQDDLELQEHQADLEKLRAWLLGFQVRGVERMKFLKEQASGQLELAA